MQGHIYNLLINILEINGTHRLFQTQHETEQEAIYDEMSAKFKATLNDEQAKAFFHIGELAAMVAGDWHERG